VARILRRGGAAAVELKEAPVVGIADLRHQAVRPGHRGEKGNHVAHAGAAAGRQGIALIVGEPGRAKKQLRHQAVVGN